MATALEIFDALEEATADLDEGSEFIMNSREGLELSKLTEADLMSRHLGKNRAEEVAHHLGDRNFEALAATLGVKLIFSDDAPRLVEV